ncbi:MAG TPA: hypothetical protein DDZ84_13385 [Firmicutes bacterium]|jgi:hypothetical protein|nr:hypothetical protein [Bacillota bacterium]
MLGYLFQCRVALLDAIRRIKEQESFRVTIETLDDVAFETDGSPTELLQVKHKIRREGSLSNASADLWKSIRVWVDGFTTCKWSSDTAYYLITTARAERGSIASCLRADLQRDVEQARRGLDEVARTSSNRDNESAYTAYRSLSQADRRLLVEQITVLDGFSDIVSVDRDLRRELALVVKRELIESLITRLEGWWFGRIIVYLQGTKGEPIQSEEIDAQLERLRRQLREDNLPIDQDLRDLEIDEAAFNFHPFVEQLRLIDLINKRIITAMRQYYRASSQRSRWLREGLILVGDLAVFDKHLREEWETRFDEMMQRVGTETAELEMRMAARDLYKWAEQEDSLFIRPECREPFVSRGSLQILSDRLLIGWHPEFQQRLECLIEEGTL